jgi:aminoglycoside phosphotransferase (APT) family kinase protein
MKSRTHPELTPARHAVLDDIDSVGATLDGRWAEIDAFCAQMPQTLAHCDLVEKNIRITADRRGGLSVFVYDWDTAGLGCPAPDLAMFHYNRHDDDVMAYLEPARQSWGYLDPRDMKRMAHIGAVFRHIAALHWACKSLRLDRLERALKHIPTYTAGLRELASELD